MSINIIEDEKEHAMSCVDELRYELQGVNDQLESLEDKRDEIQNNIESFIVDYDLVDY